MSEYHRLFVKGGTYFFTVVTYNRQPLLCEVPALIRLKAAFRYVMDKHWWARRWRSFAHPTSEHFQGYCLCKNKCRLV